MEVKALREKQGKAGKSRVKAGSHTFGGLRLAETSHAVPRKFP
ncbi:MAG: hypothetical protein ACI8Z1_003467, partial [Candidatus Azotimanducaceae bacterium]